MSYSRNSIWIDYEFKPYYQDSRQSGLRLHFDKNIDNKNRENIELLFFWLRKRYFFPYRCELYLFNQKKFRSKVQNQFCQGIFFSPNDLKRAFKPHVYIAVDTEASFLYYAIFHELTHYYQWYFREDEKRTDRSLEIEANKYAQWLLNEYLNHLTCVTPTN